MSRAAEVTPVHYGSSVRRQTWGVRQAGLTRRGGAKGPTNRVTEVALASRRNLNYVHQKRCRRSGGKASPLLPRDAARLQHYHLSRK